MSPTRLTLTNKELMPLFESLFALDGKDQGFEPDGRPKPRIPYKFGSKGEARLASGRNIKALTSPYEELTECKKKLRIETIGSAEPFPDEHKHPEYPRLEAEWKEIMAATQDVELYILKWDDLRAEDNGLPGSVVAKLLPILKTE